MAVVGTVLEGSAMGNLRYCLASLAFDSSYPTGGEAVSLNAFQDITPVLVSIAPQAGYVFEWVYSTSKIKAYWCAGSGAVMSEVTNTTDLSALTAVKVLVFGH